MTDDDRLDAVLRSAAPDLLAYLQRRIEPQADAADALAETMIVAWRRSVDIPSTDEDARRWLFGIARGTLLNLERSRRRRRRLAARIRSLIAEGMSAPPADAGADVRDAIARLEPDLAELVRLVHWEGFSLVDAAEIVGIPASTARGRYSRAKEDLRAMLAPAG